MGAPFGGNLTNLQKIFQIFQLLKQKIKIYQKPMKAKEQPFTV